MLKLNIRVLGLTNNAGVLQNDRQIVQQKRKLVEGNNDQKWFYREDGYLYPRNDPNLVLDIRVSAHFDAESPEKRLTDHTLPIRAIRSNQGLRFSCITESMRII